MRTFEYIRHPRTAQRHAAGPATVDGQHNRSTAAARFNAALAVRVTRVVGSVWCAYVFALIALVSLPAAVRSGDPVIMVQWLSSVFLQLVLLSIILVGQGIQGSAADKRAADTFADAESILHECVALQHHLAEQDTILAEIRGTPRGS